MEDSVIGFRPYLIVHDLCFDKAEFEIVRNSILKHLLAYGPLAIDKLGLLVANHLKDKFAGSLSQQYEAVRQVLEARGEIHSVASSGPPIIEIAG